MGSARWLLDTRKSALAIVTAALVISGLALWSDVSRTLNQLIEPARFGLVSRKASGKVLVVEMDAASAAAIRQWPWSRANYADVVDALRKAGAASIVFDVDFSSASDPAGDRAFASALERAKDIAALPTFGQEAGTGDARTIDALPIPLFRPHVALASVSVAPGPDGIVREMPYATMTAGVPRPSLSAYISGRSGKADESFPIDMSIDPNTIPRLRFISVRDGRFDPSAVRGKNVLIGATAIEMGDRYGTALHGVIPGVVIQALAAETLIRGVPFKGSVAFTIPLALLLAIFAARARSMRSLAWRSPGTAALLIGIICLAQHQFDMLFPLATGLILISIASMLASARLLVIRFQDLRMVDEATGLPNRHAMMTATKPDGDAVVVLRMVNFEDLIAVLGMAAEPDIVHRIVDRLRLIAVGQQVFRIGNHALAFRVANDVQLDETLDGLRSILVQPIEVLGRRVDAVTALGVAQDPGACVEQLLNEAARAAESASDEGLFWKRAATDVGALERSLTLMGELDQAVASHELLVYYQPKLDLRSGTIVSAEALVRWAHPQRGFVPPDMFIPMAEQTDRIAPLTLYVLSRVLADLSRLRENGQNLSVAVNISAKLLALPSFTAQVEAMVAGSPLPPSALVFEVTESAAMSNPDLAIAALARFRLLGIAVSMDDYGTGQSTLTYLRQLPLNELKIDRSFVQHAHRNRNDGLLVKSTIELAHELNLKVVAEGVESQECLNFLRSIGCDLIQGYYVSRPLPFSEFVSFVRETEHRGSGNGFAVQLS